ncbi:MAG TPA: hypothetical protein VNA89_12675 [Gemmatimonadaceae bacterium]|nr:hypothetical protein [Gemmatimonadaceae bacterium]
MWDDTYRREDESAEPWRSEQPWSPEAADADAWRGELHRQDEAWRAPVSPTDESCQTAPTAEQEPEREWRGDLHLADWPEWDAGPEYRMWKKLSEGES